MAQQHEDYSGTPLPKKLGIREGARIHVVASPEGFEDALALLPGGVQRIGLAGGLAPAGRLWVGWPKKGSGVPTDLDFEAVQRIRLDAGLVDNKSASITETFQGLQFVVRVKDRAR